MACRASNKVGTSGRTRWEQHQGSQIQGWQVGGVARGGGRWEGVQVIRGKGWGKHTAGKQAVGG